MEIELSEKIKTMQLAQKGIEIEQLKDSMEYVDWVEQRMNIPKWVIVEPTWNFENELYRPVAPEGYEHIGELREPLVHEYYLNWYTGTAMSVSFGKKHYTTRWILRKVEPEPDKDDDLVEPEAWLPCPECKTVKHLAIGIHPGGQYTFIWCRKCGRETEVNNGNP